MFKNSDFVGRKIYVRSIKVRAYDIGPIEHSGMVKLSDHSSLDLELRVSNLSSERLYEYITCKGLPSAKNSEGR
jgi:hypothetical protein